MNAALSVVSLLLKEYFPFAQKQKRRLHWFRLQTNVQDNTKLLLKESLRIFKTAIYYAPTPPGVEAKCGGSDLN